ncbi:PREDICTED: F-box/kelch-repeat protein At5g51250-like [Camelina sativa]|uniref:F-box/kelch-repeat protein At5g51250-like n=1 Tax=Camelina sativa TaxID=90675 RepID=A0ABM0SZQ7_CAMSA|nr:PREDICTED: F-box/kelch-repeat protein At5g51250-like [Camelina sativa]
MSSLEKKKKLSPITSLPDDLLLSIVARVSRLYYTTLSLVSKSFRSLLASPDLYKTRSLLGNTESCLYVCFQCNPGYRWFTLCRKPDQTLTNDTSGYVLATVPSPRFHKACFSSLVAVGSDIYNIHAPSSSNVSVLDCRSHTWREAPAPTLPVKELSISASVIGRKIYVVGCYNNRISPKPLKVLDTKTQVWETIPCKGKRDYKFKNSKSTCIDGKFHVVTERKEVVAYNPKESRWDLVEQWFDEYNYMRSVSYCDIKNVLYSVYNRMVIWYDTEPEVSRWRYLEVGELPTFPPGVSVRLADYGGKLAGVWDDDLFYGQSSFVHKKKILCAVVALERRKSGEIFGKVEWLGHVLTIPREYDFVKALAATV